MISVIVPVYKVEKYLPQCIESIQKQTYKELEIILVDDGSPDRSPQICDLYAQGDSRIKVIHQDNKGLSGARNAGLEIATGEYIGFVDSDDYIKENMYEVLYRALNSEKADMAICSYEKVSEEGERLENISPIKNDVLGGYDILKKLTESKGWYYVTMWNRLYKKELFSQIRLPEGKNHEDEAVAHKIYLAAEKVVTIGEALYCYRNAENSIMSNRTSIKRLDGVEALYERFCAYQEAGLNELLWGAYISLRNTMDVLGNVKCVTKEDKLRKKQIKQMFRYALKNVEGNKGIKDYMIAWFPECYFCLKRWYKRI